MEKEGTRRSWTRLEEAALLDVLDELVRKGYRRENGQFKPGSSLEIEHQLSILCPNSSLKAIPHIESKMRSWKRIYGLIFDMLRHSGFGWNNILKCVEVDSDNVWKSYVQAHKEAKGWRNKSFPLYERLANIYGDNRATRLGAQAQVDVANEVDQKEEVNEVNENNETQVPVRQTSISTNSQQSHSTSRKRKKSKTNYNDIAETFVVFSQLLDQSYKRMESLVERVFGNNDDPRDVSEDIIKMGLSPNDEMDAMVSIVDNPNYVRLFRSLSEEKKVSFVAKILRDRDYNRNRG